MRILQMSLAAILLVGGMTVYGGQRGDEHGGGGRAAPAGHQSDVGHGYVPQHGPAPRAAAPAAHNAPAPRGGQAHAPDRAGHPEAPHVHTNGQWVGHENGANYHLDHPWQHGHFGGSIGPSHIYRLGGGGPSRFFLDGGYFAVAVPDLGYVTGWLLNADDLILYDDPVDPGYYLAYDPRTGVYVHVTYVGS
jgi:hypothetical protein